MTYIAKGAGTGLSKIGDITKGLKGIGNIEIPKLPDNAVTLPDGSTMLPDGTFHLPDGTKVPDGGIELPNGSVKFPDDAPVLPEGTTKLPTAADDLIQYVDREGNLLDKNGDVVQSGKDALEEPSPDINNPAPHTDSPVNSPVREPVPAGVGARNGDDVIRLGSDPAGLGDLGRIGDDLPGGQIGDNLPGGNAGNNIPTGHIGDNLPRGQVGDNLPGGRADDLGHTPSNSHEPPTGGHGNDGPGGHNDGPNTHPSDGSHNNGGHQDPPNTGGHGNDGPGNHNDGPGGGGHNDGPGDGPGSGGDHTPDNTGGHGDGPGAPDEHVSSLDRPPSEPLSAVRPDGARYVDEPTPHAGRVYDEIRATPDSVDIPAISRNTGIDPSVLQRVKTHLFRTEHVVVAEKGVAREGLFTPRDDIGDLWQAAGQRSLEPDEALKLQRLIAHEYMESHLMEAGLPYVFDNANSWEVDMVNGVADGHYRAWPESWADAGAHELTVSERRGGFAQWEGLGLDAPKIELATDLSNIDEVMEAAFQELRSKGLDL
ncbi:hypothetical protein ABZZ04_20225, partial [Streptomyces sp. NPDC006435]